MNQNNRTLTIKEVAQFLNISNQMVYNLIHDKKIDAFKVGSAIRILYSDLQSYIDQQKSAFRGSSETIENSDENIFLVKNLNLKRDNFQLQDISFQIPRGRILTILGPSGSGKTLLLKSLAGLNKFESGAIFLGSARLDNLASRDRNIGFVFEDYALIPNRSGRGNISFPLEVQKKTKLEIDPAVEALAQELNLSREDLDNLISILPEGIKHLIAIARADIRNTDILLMDEPLSRLDQDIRRKMRVFLKELVARLGKTTILTLHDPETALALSDYIAVLDQGKIVQFGPAAEVYARPLSPVVFEMTSRFTVNKLDVRVRGGKTEPFGLTADKEDGDYRLFFRADEVGISENGISAEIRQTHPLDGSRNLAQCSSPWGDLELILPADTDKKFSFIPLQYSLF